MGVLLPKRLKKNNGDLIAYKLMFRVIGNELVNSGLETLFKEGGTGLYVIYLGDKKIVEPHIGGAVRSLDVDLKTISIDIFDERAYDIVKKTVEEHSKKYSVLETINLDTYF